MIDVAETAKEYLPKLKNCALGMCGNHADAEDLVQDALVVLVSKHHTFQHRSQVFTWLHGALRYIWIRDIRRRTNYRRKLKHLFETYVDFQDPDDLTDVWHYVDALTPEMSKTVKLKVIDGLTYDKIGEKMKCPPGTAKSRFFNATKYLRDSLQEILD